MEQARAVLERLERIEALRLEDAPAGVVLGEVRALLAEAESWVETDRPGSAAEDALARCGDAMAAGERRSAAPLAAR